MTNKSEYTDILLMLRELHLHARLHRENDLSRIEPCEIHAFNDPQHQFIGFICATCGMQFVMRPNVIKLTKVADMTPLIEAFCHFSTRKQIAKCMGQGSFDLGFLTAQQLV